MTIFCWACFYSIKNNPEYIKGEHCPIDECSHSYIEKESCGGKCGGTTTYECTKCKKIGYKRWSID